MTREEAIEVYNGLINTKIKEAFEFFAPELAESEDERIRKELIKGFKFCKKIGVGKKKGSSWAGTNLNMDEVIAYLEKQNHDGKKWITPWELNRLETLRYEAGFDAGVRSEKEKQKEQKPAEWSEEDEKNLELIIDCIYTFYPDPVMKYKLKDWLKSLRPSWKPSEEQMGAFCRCVDYLEESDNEDADIMAELYEQLKQL